MTIQSPEIVKELYYEWVRDSVFKEVYELKFFHERKSVKTLLTVAHYTNDMRRTKPITDEERMRTEFPKCKGPLEETVYNGQFTLKIYNDIYNLVLPIFAAYFFDGQFKYGSRHSPSPAFWNLTSIAEDFYSIDEFKKNVIGPHNPEDYLKKYEEFVSFFTKSNLPDAHLRAIRALLE